MTPGCLFFLFSIFFLLYCRNSCYDLDDLYPTYNPFNMLSNGMFYLVIHALFMNCKLKCTSFDHPDSHGNISPAIGVG